MPRRPKKPCAKHGCPELTYRRFCKAHEKEESRNYDKFFRDPAAKKRYGGGWRKIRAAYIAKNPLCEMCLDLGKLTPAQEVHHMIELSKGGTNDHDNLQALCKSCHSSITAKAHLAPKKIFSEKILTDSG